MLDRDAFNREKRRFKTAVWKGRLRKLAHELCRNPHFEQISNNWIDANENLIANCDVRRNPQELTNRWLAHMRAAVDDFDLQVSQADLNEHRITAVRTTLLTGLRNNYVIVRDTIDGWAGARRQALQRHLTREQFGVYLNQLQAVIGQRFQEVNLHREGIRDYMYNTNNHIWRSLRDLPYRDETEWLMANLIGPLNNNRRIIPNIVTIGRDRDRSPIIRLDNGFPMIRGGNFTYPNHYHYVYNERVSPLAAAIIRFRQQGQPIYFSFFTGHTANQGIPHIRFLGNDGEWDTRLRRNSISNSHAYFVKVAWHGRPQASPVEITVMDSAGRLQGACNARCTHWLYHVCTHMHIYEGENVKQIVDRKIERENRENQGRHYD